MKARRSLPQAGFSLVEVLVSTALGAFLLTGFLSMATFQVTTARDQTSQVELQQSARQVAEMFAREVRRAGADPTCANNFDALNYANSRRIRMFSDLNGNGSIDGNDEDITYRWVNGDLVRIANGQTETLLAGIDREDFLVRYFDANGNPLENWNFLGYWSHRLNTEQREQVRRVQLILDIEQTGANGEKIRAQVSSNINLRNRFFIKAAGC